MRRQVLQQLRIVLHDGSERQIPTLTPTPDDGGRRRRPDVDEQQWGWQRAVGQQQRQLDVDRGEPHESADRGGRQELHAGGVRELGQDRHEPLLPRQHGGPEPRLPPEGRRRGTQVSLE